MDPVVRPLAADEFGAFVSTLEVGAGRQLTREALEDATDAYPLSRCWGVYDDSGRLVGGCSSDLLELTLPGPRVQVAARPTLTALLPTHRRRGLATALLARQLQDLRDRGAAMAVATTATPELVAKLGYGCAGAAVELVVDLSAVSFGADSGASRLRLVDVEEASRVLPSVYQAHRLAQPGQVLRTDGFWRMWFHDRPLYRTAPGPRFIVVAEDVEGEVAGYLTYRLVQGDLRDQPVVALAVEDLISVTDEARRALWRYCTDFGQAERVTARNVPVDEPLRWMLSESRGLHVTRTKDFLWLRLIDVAAALSSRAYSASGGVVLDVRDRLLPDNAGTYRVEGGDQATGCVRTSGAPDVRLDVADLAAACLGGTRFSVLQRAGRVEELRAGAVARLDALFDSAPAPWTVTDW